MYPLTTKQKTYEFVRIGAPYHTYLLDDILYSPNIPEYKLYIFLNAYNLDVRRRDILKERVCNNGKLVLWVYAAGISDGNKLSAKNMSDIIGLNMMIDDEQWGLNVTVTNYDHPFTHDLETNLTFGTDNLVGPVVFCKDNEATTLGKLYYSNGRSEPGFCVRAFPNFTSVWIGAPMIPAKLIRNIARYAGVHIFNEQSDVLYANRDFVAIHTNRSGKRHITLPLISDVIDVFEKRVVAKMARSFVDYVPANKTKLYYYGKENEIF
jgi:hypothetical protein